MPTDLKTWDIDFQKRLLETRDFKAFLRLFFRSPSSKSGPRLPKALTYAEFSRRAGFSSRSYIVDVLEGRKPLGPTVVEKIVRGLALPALWREYFRLLAAMPKAKDPASLQKKLVTIRAKISKRAKISRIAPSDPSGFSGIVRADLPRIYAACGSEEGGASLAEILARTRGNPEKTERVLEKLEGLDLVQKKDDRYYPRYPHLAFERLESESFFRQDFHANLELAKKRLNDGARLRQSALFFSSTLCVKQSRMKEFSSRLRDLLHDFVSDIEASDGDCIADLVLGFTDNAEID